MRKSIPLKVLSASRKFALCHCIFQEETFCFHEIKLEYNIMYKFQVYNIVQCMLLCFHEKPTLVPVFSN